MAFLAGMKFGSSTDLASTWAMNTFLPGLVAHRYKDSRIVALSTGNVYGLTPVSLGGATEGDPVAPVGEYAQSCLGRERMLAYVSMAAGTKVTIIRLNYSLFPLDSVVRAIAAVGEAYASAGVEDRFQGRLFDGPHEFTVPMQEEAFAWLDRWL